MALTMRDATSTRHSYYHFVIWKFLLFNLIKLSALFLVLEATIPSASGESIIYRCDALVAHCIQLTYQLVLFQEIISQVHFLSSCRDERGSDCSHSKQ